MGSLSNTLSRKSVGVTDFLLQPTLFLLSFFFPSSLYSFSKFKKRLFFLQIGFSTRFLGVIYGLLCFGSRVLRRLGSMSFVR